MKQRLKPIIRSVILLAVLIILPTLIFAQMSDPGCDPGCNCRADGSICPIDNGVYALLAVGIGYGLVRVRNAKKSEGKKALSFQNDEN